MFHSQSLWSSRELEKEVESSRTVQAQQPRNEECADPGELRILGCARQVTDQYQLLRPYVYRTKAKKKIPIVDAALQLCRESIRGAGETVRHG